MIVIDASSLVELLLGGAKAGALARRLAGANAGLHAPHLIDVETLHAIRKQLLRGTITSARGDEALERFAQLRLSRYPHAPLIKRAWELRQNVSAYDAIYVSLAESLDAPLLTCDRRLASATGHAAKIEAL